jgi:DNA ligase-associated metallophosphoesterase
LNAPTPYTILEQQFWLSPERAIFWEQESALILSDLHFGKTGHFRKNGIGIPQAIYQEDLQRLIDLISFFKPNKIIAVGDLFHSVQNLEMELFSKWRNDFSAIEFVLVKGNHDILLDSWYEKNNIQIAINVLNMGQFVFVHDPKDIPIFAENSKECQAVSIESPINQPVFAFSGHLHPGVSISGMSKQSLHFPCFYFTETNAILPAFSKFSGTATVKKKKENTIFAIVNHTLIEIGKGK